MKPAILIFALSRSPWIGGIYYRKNIIHMLLLNKKIMGKYNVIVLTNDSYKNVFEVFKNKIKIISCHDETGVIKAILQAVKCCIRHKVKYVFPLGPLRFLKFFGIIPVSWIADFQHCHYPEFFEKDEIDKRNFNFRQIAEAKNPLVLSSNNALEDFRTYYSTDRKNIFVIHFTSYIEDELKKLNFEKEQAILKTYELCKYKYAVICNQFWQHKNHIVVLEAIKILNKNNSHMNFKFIFTGDLSDRRNPEYIEKIKKLSNDADIKNSIKILGFIDRTAQLCLMKYADFLIQPSLFEGWGTVIEDGKILNKRMILSDIAIHKEQKDNNCIFFKKEDPEDLACAINKMFIAKQKCKKKNFDLSEHYSKEFEKIFV